MILQNYLYYYQWEEGIAGGEIAREKKEENFHFQPSSGSLSAYCENVCFECAIFKTASFHFFVFHLCFESTILVVFMSHTMAQNRRRRRMKGVNKRLLSEE